MGTQAVSKLQIRQQHLETKQQNKVEAEKTYLKLIFCRELP
jgi:hypothetical protein